MYQGIYQFILRYMYQGIDIKVYRPNQCASDMS